MKLPNTLAWLIDEASAVDGADQFLATLGTKLIADDVPLAGAALTLAAPHPMIARRNWLWRDGGRPSYVARAPVPSGPADAAGRTAWRYCPLASPGGSFFIAARRGAGGRNVC